MFHPSSTRVSSFRFCASAALLVVLGACSTGQTGGEVTDGTFKGDGLFGSGEGPNAPVGSEEGDTVYFGVECEEVKVVSLALEESTSLGVSADEVIALIAGKHEATLSWGQGSGSSETNPLEGPGALEALVVTPEAGSSTIEIEVLPISGGARLIERQEVEREATDVDVQEGGEGKLLEEGDTLEGSEPVDDVADAAGSNTAVDNDSVASEACADEIRIEADVVISSENGAFDDTFRAIFTAKNGVFVSTVIELEPGRLDGNFAVELGDLENGKLTNTQLSLAFVLGSMSGKITGAVEESNENYASQMGMRYGHFPANACEFGYVLDGGSEWALNLATILEAKGEFDLDWQDGEAAVLKVEPTLGKLCYEPGAWGGGESWSAELSTKVSSDDERIGGIWDLQARITLGQDGEIEFVSVFRNDNRRDIYSADSFETQTGIVVASEADTLGFEFGYEIDLKGEAAARGQFKVFEIVPADCTSPGPVQQSPDGAEDLGDPPPTGVNDVKEDDTASSGSEPSGDSSASNTSGDSASGGSDDEPPPDQSGPAGDPLPDVNGSEPSQGSSGCAGDETIEVDSAKLSER